MNHTEQRKRLRALVAGTKCHAPANIFDPLSARAAESVGFEIGLLSGSAVSATTLAAPDLNLHTLTEYADQVRRIMRVSNLSLLVDADDGYGNALNVMRTIQELEHAGVSAVSIEDTAGPMRFGEAEGGNRLIPIAEGVGKMRAAVAARSDPSLIIAARTPALRMEGVQSAIKRATAYAATGVDMIFLSGGLDKLEPVQAVHAATRLPIIVGSRYGSLKREDLAACGVRIMLQGHQSISAAYKAVREIYAHLFKGGTPADLTSKIKSAREMETLIESDSYKHYGDVTGEMESLINSERYKQWLREYMR